MSVVREDTLCIACSILRAEIEELTKRGEIDFPVKYVNSMLHMRPEKLKETLDEMIRDARGEGRKVLLLFGECHAYMRDQEEPGRVCRVRGINCPEIILGGERYRALRKEGAFFLMPEWTRKWEEVFKGELGLNEEVGRELLGEMHKKLIYLDSGMVPIPKKELEEASAYSGLPFEIVPLSLSHLQNGIEEGARRLEIGDIYGDKTETEGSPAYHGMVFYMMREILKSADNPANLGKYITDHVRELTGARTVILYQSLTSMGRAGHRVVAVNPDRRKQIAGSPEICRLAELVHSHDKTVIWHSRERGGEAEEILARAGYGMTAATPLVIGDTTIGSLILLGLPDLNGIQIVVETLDMIATIAGLVLRNAFLFEEQEKIIEKRTEELRESESRYRGLFEEAPISLWEEDGSELKRFFDTLKESGVENFEDYFHNNREAVTHCASLIRVLDVNRNTLDLYGASDKEELLGNLEIVFGEETYEVFKEELIAFARGDTSFEAEAVTRSLSGEKIEILLIVRVVTGQEETLSRLLVSVVDISARKKAENALVIERERLNVTLLSIGDGVIASNREGEVVLVNRVAEKLTGWTQEEAMGQPLKEVFHIVNERTRIRCENPVDIVMQTGGIVPLANHTMLVSKGGQEYLIEDSGAPIRGGDGRIIGVVLVFRDVTAERRAKEELVRGQKLESLGVLAGGIAHDFNNILTAVMGNVAVAKMYMRENEEALSRLSEAEDAIIRARGLTNQLLTFSKGGAPVRKIQHVGKLIRDSADFVLSGSNVKSEFDVPGELWPVDLDASQFGQVISNLVINADHAMPEGGKIEVSCENVEIGNGDLPLPPGRYVRVTIRDGGMGISDEHLEKVFDPYFTTKQKGSGLGLTTSYSIVKNHDGLIEVDSILGEGTAFHIYLPASASGSSVDDDKEKAPLRGEGKILIMDDEDIVRAACRGMLETLGYEVEEANGGDEAVDRYRDAIDAGSSFDGVIMDLTVPGGMGGKEAVIKLLKLDPGAKVIVSSGYSNNPIMSSFSEHGFKGVLVKPYRVGELSRVLSQILHKD